MEIGRIRVRGNYPTQRSLFRSMDVRFSPESKPPLSMPGYRAPIVEFESGGELRQVPARDVDIPFLCQPDQAKTADHLRLILRGQDGDQAALAALQARVEGRFRKMRLMHGNLRLEENPNVIPSTCGETLGPDRVSHKGSVLLRLSRLGYPVPDFVILASGVYLEREKRLRADVHQAVEALETLTFRKLLFSEDPLVIAIRCAMPDYVPGVMPTFLNVGITDGSLPGLEKVLGREAARRSFLNNLRNMIRCIDSDAYRRIRGELWHNDSPAEVEKLIASLSDIIQGHAPKLLTDPVEQALFFVRESYKLFEKNRDLLLTLSRGRQHYPSIILQRMVCTVRSRDSFAGFLCSRHSKTGDGHQLETGRNIFGEEIMTGTIETEKTDFHDPEEIKRSFPAVYHFYPQLAELEKEFASPVMIECGAEEVGGHQLFALLQLNEIGMTGQAAVVSVVDMHKARIIDRKRAAELVCPYHLKQLESDSIDEESFTTLADFCGGVAILPRCAVSARIYFSAESALRAKRRGESVCFCKETFNPTDTVVMREMDAIISLTSAAIHVVTICQTYGFPALLNVKRSGVRLTRGRTLVNAEGLGIHEGEWITVSSRRQKLFKGRALYQPALLMRFMRGEHIELPEPYQATINRLTYAYRYYQQLVRGIKYKEVDCLNDLVRLVSFDLRDDEKRAMEMVNGWFDANEERYAREVLSSELGDHLNQHRIFDLLSLNRKVRFFKAAISTCTREGLSGFAAGAFMLGRFISRPLPAAFWRNFSPAETAVLIDEWLLFEKYMSVLQEMGERRVNRARKKILQDGLGEIPLNEAMVRPLVPIKLAKVDLSEVREAVPPGADPQASRVIELLERPFGGLFDFDAPWALRQLEELCKREGLPLPSPCDV